ncbi:MAG TPA: serine/threonine-protein kinase, partial [Pilimelia sp.]|nr:serine/threonine-protein kinase [Pilimelia sp.]
MGTVWQATDTLLHRDVAVKEVVPPASMADSDREAMYARTMREARAAACLSHPSVVQVYDVVTAHDRPWIVMELLDARSLADMIVGDGPLAPRAVAKIGIALLGALEVAHAAGILHRDVKPANVLIASDGRCVLTDFGVAHMPTGAQLTTPGMVLGSPHFISPERAIGQSFGPPSDLFSLGVTLYTAVEGRPPFDRGDPIETMHAVVEEPPAPLLRAGPLGPVLSGLLDKDPRRRTTVDEARQRLRELLAGPLASTAPVHAQTDPYAVVPAQRVTSIPRERPAPAARDKIGGRAMLAPGESLTDRLRRLRAGHAAPRTRAPGAAPAAAGGPAAPGSAPHAPHPADVPTGPQPVVADAPAPSGGAAPGPSGSGVHLPPGGSRPAGGTAEAPARPPAAAADRSAVTAPLPALARPGREGDTTVVVPTVAGAPHPPPRRPGAPAGPGAP